jgi:hypothetical protein
MMGRCSPSWLYFVLVILGLICHGNAADPGMLSVQASESRTVMDLSGVWRFKVGALLYVCSP